MPLIWGDEVARFVPESDPAEWFDLKKELSSGDDDAILALVFGSEITANAADDVRLTMRVDLLNRERVRRSIVAWSYTRDGVPVELTAENVDRLDRRTYADLVEEVDRRNPLVLQQKKNKNGGASSPTTAATGKRQRA